MCGNRRDLERGVAEKQAQQLASGVTARARDRYSHAHVA
jgi:hypothetical protein